MKYTEVVKIFDSLSQEARFLVFKNLVRSGQKGLYPANLLKKVKVTSGTLSFHLKELERNNVITSERQGKQILYRVNSDTLAKLTSFLIDECNFLIDQEVEE